MALPTLVYVGTYTGPKSKGIYLFRLQTENLEVPQNVTLVPLGLAAETTSPSFLELDPKRHAYLVPATGAVEVGGERIEARDGVAITDVAKVEIVGLEDAELVVVDAA